MGVLKCHTPSGHNYYNISKVRVASNGAEPTENNADE